MWSMEPNQHSRRHFLFAIALVAICALGAFSWIAIDAASIETTYMEGAIYVVARKSDSAVSENILKSVDSIEMEDSSMQELDELISDL